MQRGCDKIAAPFNHIGVVRFGKKARKGSRLSLRFHLIVLLAEVLEDASS
jgi:hypothetical protein